MEKVVKKYILGDSEKQIKDDLAYWLSKSSEERIAVVEELRKQYHNGTLPRLQRVFKIIQRK